MRFESIKFHLKPYGIVARRRTTINHAFAAAIAPNDEFDKHRVREAILSLGQDPDGDLLCAYCEMPAQTWDHIFGTVRDSRFSGHGHRIGNLLPCCKNCNSSKGNKNWEKFLEEIVASQELSKKAYEGRHRLISSYIAKNGYADSEPISSPKYLELLELKEQIFDLLKKADELAKSIRESRRE